MTLEEYKAQYSDSINMVALDKIIANLYRAGNFIGSESDKWITRHIEQNQEEYDRQSQEWEKQYLRMKNDKNTAMKDNNLDAAPTEQELIDSNFLQLGENDFCIELNTQTKLHVRYIFLECEVFLKSENPSTLSLYPTKSKINDVVCFYGLESKCDFVWNKPKPKVGQVWENHANTVVLTEIDKKGINVFYIYSEYDKPLSTDKFLNRKELVTYGYKKEADNLEQYYKEKQLKQDRSNLKHKKIYNH